MLQKKSLASLAIICVLLTVSLSCQKQEDQAASKVELSTLNSKSSNEKGHLQQTKTFSSALVISWLNMQLVMLKTGGQASDRAQAYCGIALYESVVQGMPAYQSLFNQLTNFPVMPATEPGEAYHWAASANAALAQMNRKLFPTTAAANQASIDQLEDQFEAIYKTEVDDNTLQRSIAYGTAVANKVFAWAVADGFSNVNVPYVAPVNPILGLWIPTSSGPAANAYAFQRRPMVPGVASGTALTPPPPYSVDHSSAYYAMVNDVYLVSKTLTTDQKAMADYFKDAPGYGPGGGFVALLSQAFDITKPSLDVSALTYAKVGIAQHEATIILNTNKYIFNVMRPVTYIKANIDPAWSTYIATPNHPEFPSGHATTNGAVISMMINMFGDNFPITLHTYDYLGYPPRNYRTFTQIGLDMANSRLYGGLHYRATCEKSLEQGKKIAQNILSTIKFLKE